MGAGWLDFKLGYRMLIKYPGLTFVGGLAIAVAIAIGAAAFEFTHDLINPTLPFEEGERIVAIQNLNVATGNPEHRALHDFAAWREAVTSIEDLGAYATIERNLITDDGASEPVEIAEVTASAFRLARTPALLGRPLVAGDEQPGAPLVAVIGYGVWQTRFGADPNIVGRTMQLGAARTTVVGVMPQAFGFPVAHRMWMPLRAQAADYQRLDGPSLRIFGRLAPGVSIEQAQAEISAIGTRAAASSPETHAQLRPRVVPYVRSFYGEEMVWQIYGLQSIFVLLVVVACANVATLIYARTATREGEIVLRTALGASRRRIVAQLFVEALVLASASAVVGLTAASWALSYAMDVFWSVQGEARPFWWNDELSPATVAYVTALAVGGAAVAGVLPALNATRRRVQTGLQDLAAGSTRLRFGGVWTVVIVTQVALSVAFLPTAISEGWQAMQDRAADIRIPVDRLLSVRLEFDRPEAAAATYREVARRVAAEPGVLGVTFADRLPGTEHARRRIEVDDATAATPTVYDVRAAAVDVQYFETLGSLILGGRGFRPDDLEPNRSVVIVNQSFVRRVLADRNPIGRRIRSLGAQQPLEIVGVVPDLSVDPDPQGDQSGIYFPATPETAAPLRMVVHVAGDAAALAPRVRALTASVDPSIRIYDLMPIADIGRNEQLGTRLVASVLALVASIALLLSTVGVYALMSFTVSQRTREIGIRVALGADARQVVAAIFSRALFQLGIGVAAGASIAVLVAVAGEGDQIVREGPGLLLAVSGLMMLVGLFSCVVPAARGLRIQPTEALRQRW